MINAGTPAVRVNLVSLVRDSAKGALSNYLARNQTQNLVSAMRSRYAFRLMSGPARFYGDFRGLGNKIAIFGFVGLSFGGVVQNQNENLGENGWSEHETVPINDIFKEATRGDFQKYDNDNCSISGDSDITVLSDEEDVSYEVVIISDPDNSYITISEDEVIREMDTDAEDLEVLVEKESEMQDELSSLLQSACQQNVMLRQLILMQNKDEAVSVLIKDLDALVDMQQKELLSLRETVLRQKIMLSALSAQLQDSKGDGRRRREWKREGRTHAETLNSLGGVLSELEMEQLRVTRGRVRGLKVHRKQRKKPMI